MPKRTTRKQLSFVVPWNVVFTHGEETILSCGMRFVRVKTNSRCMVQYDVHNATHDKISLQTTHVALLLSSLRVVGNGSTRPSTALTNLCLYTSIVPCFLVFAAAPLGILSDHASLIVFHGNLI